MPRRFLKRAYKAARRLKRGRTQKVITIKEAAPVISAQQKKTLKEAGKWIGGAMLAGGAVGGATGYVTSHKGKRGRGAKWGAVSGVALGGASGGIVGGTGAGLYQRGKRAGMRKRRSR